MSNTPVPKFTYPGDDPELDRLLNEARIEGANELTSFPDMFGRRGAEQAAAAAAAAAEEEKRKSAAAAAAAGTAAAAKVPEVSTRPTVTELPAGAAPKRQARWLAIGALAIVGPVVALAIGAFRSAAVAQGALGSAGSAAAVSAGAMVASGIAVPRIEEDAGAVSAVPAVTSAPSGARPAVGVGAKVWPKIKDDPYDGAAPKSAKTAEVVVTPPTPTVAPSVLPAAAPKASAGPTPMFERDN